MINRTRGQLNLALLAGASAIAIAVATPTAAQEVSRKFDIPAQSLSSALLTYSRQADTPVIASMDLLKGKTAPAVSGDLPQDVALNMLLAGSGLRAVQGASGGLIVEKATTDPQSSGAAGDGAEVEALIVTAQKREEDIQDVPIAISAFTQEALERSQVAGGPDLITQVPNMTFTKTNFSSYSIQLRGIGTQAISATTDAAVAVAFNNTPFIRNRFFEQEFYDLQRVEVLRGPQGTLYGRNATAGVVNIISQKPKFTYDAKLSADVSNYNSTRLEAMANVPLVDDKVALRVAGAWTKREGYSTNEITGNPIDGRDLWSTRVSLRFTPSDAIDASLIWEHFEEDDDRLRSGKQLCHTDTVTSVAGIPTAYDSGFDVSGSIFQAWAGIQGTFSQGCAPASLYSSDSFETPNGLALPFVGPLRSIGVPIAGDGGFSYSDPYLNKTQSRDLRVIESTVDPAYKAESDVMELQFSADLSENLTLASETAYSVDTIFSTQDYNRFNTAPGLFQDSMVSTDQNYRENALVDGVYCDPQIGCADRLVAVDLSTARSRQFSQELRLSSDFEGPFNFSLGANFLRYDTEDKYYVFINTMGMFSVLSPYAQYAGANLGPYIRGVSDNAECLRYAGPPDPTKIQTVNGCIYVDPNPIGSLNDKGHNYFLSKNPYKLISYAVFGESYYNITENLKVTAGLRLTIDKKEAPRIPSWILAADSVGYPVAETVEREWREPTGRLAIDWKPDLGFTDETLLYASYAHGYKAGGMNPPASGIVCFFCSNGATSEFAEALLAASHPKTFAPEFVDAFEIGAKNTLLGGRLTLNAAAFYYDYTGYQISQIVNRAAVNYNFDAEVWGLELEADWRPLENLRFGFKGGYENTRVADGMRAIDTMDRANGGLPDENGVRWIVARPFPTFPSNCILPLDLFVGELNGQQVLTDVGARGTGASGPCELAYVSGKDPITGLDYVPNPVLESNLYGMLQYHPGYEGWNPATAPNHGAGISKDLSGNELPNAPHFTATLTADYTMPLSDDWLATLHTDLYYQSEAWTRIFNMEGYDKLKAYTNVNLAAIFQNEKSGWKVMAYVKNVFDRANITGAFLNSDDTGLTTNVFMTEPRLYGLRVTKEFSGGPWWTGGGSDANGAFPLKIEVAGQVQRHEAPSDRFATPSMASLEEIVDVGDIQDRGLDWGDGRSLKVIWQPANSRWSASLGIRYGRTNGKHAADRHYETPPTCGWPDIDFYGYSAQYLFCDPRSSYFSGAAIQSVVTWSDAEHYGREEHDVVDFDVGLDVGIGRLSSSRVHAGLRYAELESTSSLRLMARDHWTGFDDTGWILKLQTNVLQRVDITARREFSGYGPTLGWDGAVTLWEAGDVGHLDVDWSVTGGILFGEEETQFDGQDVNQLYRGKILVGLQPFGDAVVAEPPANRTKDVTVPLVDLSLGLSYDVGRLKVGAGYRWERYFNVLDVGYDEAKDGDRTIDGPYFKLSVGFGG